MQATSEPLRIAEILAALSLATDMANGNPPEKTLRVCTLAIELASVAGCPEPVIAETYFAALLRFIGCTSYAHESAALLGGDDIDANRVLGPIDSKNSRAVFRTAVTELGSQYGSAKRVRTVVSALVHARGFERGLVTSQCEVATRLAARLSMSDGVVTAVGQAYERWDGRGGPLGLAEGSIAMPARLVHIAMVAALHFQRGGWQLARDEVRRRRGGQLDPVLVDRFLADAEALCASVEGSSLWDRVVAAAPRQTPWTSPPSLGAIASAFGDFADLKSVFSVGHSSGVAALARQAGERLGLGPGELASLEHAAFFHDLGSVSVATGVWEKPTKLTDAEWERVRLHPYYTARVLSRSPVLAPLGVIAGAHHERVDGSGYPHGAVGGSIPMLSRVLAAADAYHALTESRSYRGASNPQGAAEVLDREARERGLDREAVRAVLESAGHRAARTRGAWPAGLSDREVQVLRRLARGGSNKEIARELGISARTVQHHVMHIYAKIEVTTRAAAALYAAEHDLLDSADA